MADLYALAEEMLQDMQRRFGVPGQTTGTDDEDDAGDANTTTSGCDHPADTPEPREGTS